jgi:hypothetical protein
VTAGDAALARRFAVGLSEPNFADSLAADVSGDGRVNAGDASLIEQFVVGLIEDFPAGSSNGSTQRKALASESAPPASAQTSARVRPMSDVAGEVVWGEPVAVDSVSKRPSEEAVRVPVRLESPWNVRAVQLDLRYDPSALQVVSVRTGTPADSSGKTTSESPWRAAINRDAERGRVRLALSRARPAEPGPVATLTVTVGEDISPSEAVLRGRAVLNTGTRRSLPELSVEPAPRAFSVSPPAPNPFSEVATLRYALPERREVQIEIFDALGRRVRTVVNREQGPGRHAKQISGEGLPSGAYFYRLEAGRAVRTGKFTIVR